MRDLQADLDNWHELWRDTNDKDVFRGYISDFCANVIPHAIDRAIKAEAENVELRAEVERLKRIEAAARAAFKNEIIICPYENCSTCDDKSKCHWADLGQALAELEESK